MQILEKQDWLYICENVNTVEPWYNEPLYSEVLGVTNDFLYPSNGKIYEKEIWRNLSIADEFC